MGRRLCAVVVFAAGWTASAATLERLSLEEMAVRSTAVVRARAMSSASLFLGPMIYTRTRFQVLEQWKGADQPWVEVTLPGGMVGQVTESYAGVPRFVPGQELVLFLWTGPSGRTQIIGLTQGLFEVERSASGEALAVRRPSGELVLDPATRTSAREEGIAMPLGSLAIRVRAAMGQNAPR